MGEECQKHPFWCQVFLHVYSQCFESTYLWIWQWEYEKSFQNHFPISIQRKGSFDLSLKIKTKKILVSIVFQPTYVLQRSTKGGQSGYTFSKVIDKVASIAENKVNQSLRKSCDVLMAPVSGNFENVGKRKISRKISAVGQKAIHRLARFKSSISEVSRDGSKTYQTTENITGNKPKVSFARSNNFLSPYEDSPKLRRRSFNDLANFVVRKISPGANVRVFLKLKLTLNMKSQ